MTLLLLLFRPITNQLDRMIGILVTLQDDVNALTEQVAKGTAEVLTAIDNLETQVAAGQTVDLTELKAAAQALDDIVEDPEPDQPA